MAPAGLEHLPTEILYMVLGFLGVRCHGVSRPEAPLAYIGNEQQMSNEPSWYSLECQILSTLCLISKQMRSIFQPILYREFMPGYGDSWRSTLYKYKWEGRFTAFIRTMAERRDLASLVERIYIHPDLFRPFEENDKAGLDIPEGRDDISQHIDNREAPDTALNAVANALGVEEGLQQLSARDLVVFLIAQLPNLTHCTLQTDGCSLELGRATAIPRLALTTLDIARSGSQKNTGTLFYLDQHACALLNSCPYLDTLTLHRCGGFWSQDIKIPSLAKLKTLQMTHCGMTAMDLDALVSSCTSLQSFAYEAHFIRLSSERNHPFHESRVHFRACHAAQILHRHRATLESVRIDLRPRHARFLGNEGGNPVPFSFQEFHALRHLFLTFNPAYDPPPWSQSSDDDEGILQFLPSSLKSLHLASGIKPIDDSRTQEGLLYLARAPSQGKFPNLREVRYGRDPPDDGSILNTAFAAAGVDFAFGRLPLIGRTGRPPAQVSV